MKKKEIITVEVSARDARAIAKVLRLGMEIVYERGLHMRNGDEYVNDAAVDDLANQLEDKVISLGQSKRGSVLR